MTSPQHHRIGGPTIQGRILTSPNHPYGQQNMVQNQQMLVNQQQSRFVRPMMQGADRNRIMMQQADWNNYSRRPPSAGGITVQQQHQQQQQAAYLQQVIMR